LLNERLAAQTRAYVTVSAAFNDLVHHVQTRNIDVGPALALAARARAAAVGGAGAAADLAAPLPATGVAAADDPESDGGPFHHPTLPTAPPPGFEGLEPTPPLAESPTTDHYESPTTDHYESPTTDHFHDLSVDSSAPALLT
jgi:hypothetical protein